MLRLILSLTALIASTCGKEEVKLPRAQLDEDFRLSGDLEPLHYLLRIWFDPEESGHPGFVEVTLRVVRPTSRIVIHSFQDTEQVFLVMTKFETIMARKFFPCFDEPRYKASYVINAATPSRLSTLLDVKSNSKLDYFVPGNKWPNKVQYSPVVNESGVALQCFGVADPKTLLSLVDAMAYGLRYMDKELGEEFHMLHEMAHNWFGNLVTCEDWNDIWLQEGFATFYTLRMEGGNPYARGAIVIRLLEASLGRDLYLRSIRLFIHRFANKCATSKDFIDTVLSAAEPGEIGLSYEQLRAFLVNEAHVVLDSAKPWIMPIFYTLNGKKKRAWMMHRKVSIPIPNNVIFKFDPQHILLCKYDK